MKPIHTALLLAAGLFAAGCGRKHAKSAAAESAASAAVSAAAQEPAPPVESKPVAVITSMHMQWIIDNSAPKVEINLFGENLAMDARVTSSSSQMRVERIEPGSGQTFVIVVVDPAAAPGNYEFQYQAPGQNPIPFTIQYAGPQR
jgi:hypothetical protein